MLLQVSAAFRCHVHHFYRAILLCKGENDPFLSDGIDLLCFYYRAKVSGTYDKSHPSFVAVR